MTDWLNRRLVTLEETDAFSLYCQAVAVTFCPYLAPAVRQQVLFATTYSLQGSTLADLQAEIFYYGFLHTEWLRQFRRENPVIGGLACDNLIMELPDQLRTIDGRRLFEWPHWLLKSLYTPVGIMFGKFWLGEEGVSRSGLSLPPPPCHFLSIRYYERLLHWAKANLDAERGS